MKFLKKTQPRLTIAISLIFLTFTQISDAKAKCPILYPIIVDCETCKFGHAEGFIDYKGKVIVKPNFQTVLEFNDGVGIVRISDDRSGIVNLEGKVTIFPFETLPISDFYDGVAVALIAEKYGIVDKTGRPVTFFDFPVESSEYRPGTTKFSDGLAPLPILNGGTAFVDTSGRTILRLDSVHKTWGFKDGMAWVAGTDFKGGIIDKKGNFIIDPSDPSVHSVGEPSEALVRVGKNESSTEDSLKTRYYNRKGKLEFEVPYDYSGDFESGLAKVKLNNKWGYMNRKGQMVIPADFESADDFSEGLAAVKVGGRLGFIDKTGKFVIPPQFGQVKGPFRCGLAYVTSGNFEGYVNRKGEWVWKKRT